MTILHLDYRPRELDEVVGQDAAVKSLRGLIDRRAAQTFLLTGPSGTGKTTMARIAAHMLGCAAKDIREIDAATNTGIEAMRAVQDMVQYRPFGKSEGRAVIIDECHALSRQAWQSLLKSTEEPPEHASWFFCTTEPTKVPATIKTRCAVIQLRAIPGPELRQLLDGVLEAEGHKMPPDVREAVVQEAEGSARQMLQNAAACWEARGRREAVDALRSAREAEPVVELAQFLLRGGSWVKAMGILDKLGDESPDSVRIGVCNYLGGALRRAKTDKEACRLLAVIDPFVEPLGAGTDRAALAVAVGRALYSGS